MSLEEAAEQVAEHLLRQEFVEVYAHHDADGIAAGSLLCMAMMRKNIRFRLRVLPGISPANISPGMSTLLCDFGSGLEDIPDDVMVVDHHHPHFSGGLHVNPRLAGIDGDRELSASGTAYILAQKMGDNRDLAGLAMLGIIGDGQEIAGKNLEIFNDAIAEGVITTGRGLRIVGRDDHERLLMSINPYLHQISGDEMAVADLIDSSMAEDGIALDTLLSLSVLRISPYTTPSAMRGLYGDLFSLEREVIIDGHTMAAVVDACGKSGRGGLAVSLCLRAPEGIDEAFELTRQHRMNVIDSLRAACQSRDESGFYEVGDVRVASDVADVLVRDCVSTGPVFVIARAGDLCHISARCPDGFDLDIGSMVREAALQCDGFGGGHHRRAGATINCARLDTFRGHIAGVMAQ
jgi:single-stranded-DNA-specific exonuclease